jgi:hypothetical protein
MRGMGQPNSARPILAVRHNLAGTSIHSCTFFNNSGPGVSFDGVSSGSITSSFVAGTDGPSIAVWNDREHSPQKYAPPASANITVANNIAAWARSLGLNAVTDEVANFVLCPRTKGDCNVTAHGNIAAGSENYGFVLQYASDAFHPGCMCLVAVLLLGIRHMPQPVLRPQNLLQVHL